MIVLTLCEPCRELAKHPTAHRTDEKGNEWIDLPRFCPECGAKVAQIVRLMIAGGKVVMPSADTERP